MKKLFYLFVCLICVSCNNAKKQESETKPKEVIISEITATDFCDSIYTSFPGEIIVTENYIAWVDPRESDGFCHIIDKKTGKEIAAIGNIGSGPKDFIAPSVSKVSGDRLLIYDLQNKKKALIDLCRVTEHEDQYASFSEITFAEQALRRFYITENEELSFSPTDQQPFTLRVNNSDYFGGKYPIEDTELSHSEKFSQLQGNIVYDAKKGLILYSTYEFEYMALYRKEGNRMNLLSERKVNMPEYKVIEGKLKFEGHQRIGISQVTLLKDYIVSADFSPEEKASITKKEIRKKRMLPHSLQVYDYNFNLIKIYKLDRPIWRIDGLANSNTLYAIIEDPELKMVTIKI